MQKSFLEHIHSATLNSLQIKHRRLNLQCKVNSEIQSSSLDVFLSSNCCFFAVLKLCFSSYKTLFKKQLDNIFLCSFLSHQGICQSHPYKDFGIYRAAIHCHLLQSGSGADSSLSPIPSAILPLHWKGNVTFSRKHTKTVDRRCKLWQRPITWNVFFFFHTVKGTWSFILSYTVRIQLQQSWENKKLCSETSGT